jgi:hypothetical protein
MLSGAMVPKVVADYVGTEEPVSQDTLLALESAQLITRQYRAENALPIEFAMIGGTDRNALHDPRSCLVGAGGRIDNDRIEHLPTSGLQVRACDAIFGTTGNTSTQDTIYFYVTRDGVISSATDIRLRLLWTALLMRRGEPIYFLRFMTPIAVAESAEQKKIAHEKLVKFASAMWREIEPRLTPRTVNNEM